VSAAQAAGVLLSLLACACLRVPTPLEPGLEGSIGLPYRGSLTDAVEVPQEGNGFRFLRRDERHFASPRFAEAIERAAAIVSWQRPGGKLVIGDFSVRHGGRLMPHFSHRTGHDADLVLYATTLEGAPIEAPGFVHYGPDGLAFDEAAGRYVRFDVEREWLLVRALLEDPDARIEWMFANHVVEALLIEWARARGEPDDLVLHAETVLLEPHPGGPHDDHIHVRTACSPEEEAQGCETGGPIRPWLATSAGSRALASGLRDEELAAILLGAPQSQGTQ
jgi:penicillin-insensitive murein endopeptidase